MWTREACLLQLKISWRRNWLNPPLSIMLGLLCKHLDQGSESGWLQYYYSVTRLLRVRISGWMPVNIHTMDNIPFMKPYLGNNARTCPQSTSNNPVFVRLTGDWGAPDLNFRPHWSCDGGWPGPGSPAWDFSLVWWECELWAPGAWALVTGHHTRPWCHQGCKHHKMA